MDTLRYRHIEFNRSQVFDVEKPHFFTIRNKNVFVAKVRDKIHSHKNKWAVRVGMGVDCEM